MKLLCQDEHLYVFTDTALHNLCESQEMLDMLDDYTRDLHKKGLVKLFTDYFNKTPDIISEYIVKATTVINYTFSETRSCKLQLSVCVNKHDSRDVRHLGNIISYHSALELRYMYFLLTNNVGRNTAFTVPKEMFPDEFDNASPIYSFDMIDLGIFEYPERYQLSGNVTHSHLVKFDGFCIIEPEDVFVQSSDFAKIIEIDLKFFVTVLHNLFSSYGGAYNKASIRLLSLLPNL